MTVHHDNRDFTILPDHQPKDQSFDLQTILGNVHPAVRPFTRNLTFTPLLTNIVVRLARSLAKDLCPSSNASERLR